MAWLSSPLLVGVETAQFGESGKWWTGKHSGTDFAAPTGTPVRAVAAGTVVSAGWFGNAYGNLVSVDHGGGLETWYAHLSRVGVDSGQQVGRGEIIGNVGTTGNVSGPHVHLEVRRNGTPVDPKEFLGTDPGTSNGSGGFDIPTEAELRTGFTRVGYFAGGLLLMVVGVFMARRIGAI